MGNSKVEMIGLSRVVHNELTRIKAFSVWYRKQNDEDPEKFPLSLPEDNEGVWYEMMADFDPDNEEFKEHPTNVEPLCDGRPISELVNGNTADKWKTD